MSADTIVNVQDASASIGTTATVVLAQNFPRNYLFIHNPHATNKIAVSFSTTAVIGGVGSIDIAAAGTLEFEWAVPANAISAIASGATTPITIYWE